MAVVATIGATTAAGGLMGAAAYVCGCCDPLAWRREAKVLPSIPEDAGSVKIFCKALGSKPRELRVSLSDDILLVGRKPGPADAQFFLSGAQVSAEGDNVTIVCRSGDTIILYVESGEEADLWAGELNGASMLVERSASAAADPSIAQTAITEHQDRVKNARIAELEARVNATLTAAVQRSRRIQELEVVVEQGKEREERIKELEMLVDETTAECNSRAERIKELEGIISTGNYAAIKDEGLCCSDNWTLPLPEDLLTIRSENATHWDLTELEWKIAKNKTLLYDTAKDTVLGIKVTSFWSEVVAGLALLANLWIIWYYCPERAITLQKPKAPSGTYAEGLRPPAADAEGASSNGSASDDEESTST